MTLPILITNKCSHFQKKFRLLAQDFLANLPSPFVRFGLSFVRKCYVKILKYPKSKFKFNVVSEATVLKLLQGLDSNKAAGLDNLSGKFLKDGDTVLAKICNLSIKYSIFPSDCKIAKLKPLFKKGS